jgi:uncharacterized membrane protein HdeD (DUF308 family)
MRESWRRNPWYRRINWWELLVGAVLIILGVASLIRPSLAVTGLVYAYGIAGIIVGTADILFYIRVERLTGFGPVVSLIFGVFSVMSGVGIVVNPGVGMTVFSLLFSVWFIAHCISRLANLTQVRLAEGKGMYYLAMVLNIIGLIFGALLLMMPFNTITAIGYLAALYLIVLGMESVIMAFLPF